jgi:competence CoiA-like predicted nuclease
MSVQSSLCVDNPEIKEVINLVTGDILPVQEVIGSDYQKLENLRMELAEANASNNLIYACPICMVGVYLACVRKDEKRFFFKHRTENGNCPAITRGELTKEEIEARKYNAAKESQAHIRLKEIIKESLENDPNFSEITVEKVWRGMDRSKWRKPDVQALWKGTTRIAFEIQLSTTFLHVIAERRLFYRDEGALLCWIFKRFDEQDARMTQDDIFHNNNRNLFLASEDTLKASIENKALMLDCHWTSSMVQEGYVKETWQQQLASFSQFKLDVIGQRVFLVDCESEKAKLTQTTSDDDFKQRFFLWWSESRRSSDDPAWNEFKAEFRKRRITFAKYPNELFGLLYALYTAREGRVIGWSHPKFISAAHTVAGSHKQAVRAFRAALWVYGRGDLLKSQDHEKKWSKKVEEYKEKILANDPEYQREERFDGLIAFLFPEVWEALLKMK